jgi:small GTP-binding protein
MNIIVIGDPAVGKTCLLKVYSEGYFDPSHMVTMGLDYRNKTFKPKGSDEEIAVKIWDTAG